MNPLMIIREGFKQIPLVARYAFGISVIAASVAIASSFFSSPQAAIIATIVGFILTVLIFIFVSAQGRVGRYGLPGQVLIWFILVLFIGFSTLIFTSFFFEYPKRFDLLIAQLFNAPSAISPPKNSTVTRSGQITLADIPAAMLQPISMSQDNVKVTNELANRGTLRLDNAQLVIGSPGQNRNIGLYLYRLELLNGSTIVTNGNNLNIATYEIISNDSKIVSFANPAAPPAQEGMRGLDAGKVEISSIELIVGNLAIALAGQVGARGVSGSPGANGAPGAAGDNAADRLVGCAHGGGQGDRGLPGANGSPGGKGGDGGNGGFLILERTLAQSPQNIQFNASGGTGGEGGAGGPPGQGGPGGSGGRGSTYCGGGAAGPAGASGSVGASGLRGAPGAEGQLIARKSPSV